LIHLPGQKSGVALQARHVRIERSTQENVCREPACQQGGVAELKAMLDRVDAGRKKQKNKLST